MPEYRRAVQRETPPRHGAGPYRHRRTYRACIMKKSM
jgi:hypothetical protein